jgi:hypothetical protein
MALSLVGLFAATLGSAAMTVLPGAFGAAGYAASLATITAGYALFQSANATAIMGSVASRNRGMTSGLLALARNTGLIAGASAMGAIFAVGTRGLPVLGLPPGSFAGLQLVFAAASAAAALALSIAIAARNWSSPDRRVHLSRASRIEEPGSRSGG